MYLTCAGACNYNRTFSGVHVVSATGLMTTRTPAYGSSVHLKLAVQKRISVGLLAMWSVRFSKEGLDVFPLVML